MKRSINRHGIAGVFRAIGVIALMMPDPVSSAFRDAPFESLVASYGRVARTEDTPAYYVRIWNRDAAGWRLLIDQQH